MSWSDFGKPAAILGTLMIACIAGAVRAETLVVRSTGPSAKSYPPGTALVDTARIVLQPNDQVVLLDGRGTRTLRGPGTFSPVASSASAGSRTTLGSLMAQHSDRRARIGAVRSVAAPPRPSIWMVDIDRSSNVCVADPTAVAMYRSGTTKPDSVTVQASGRSETLSWAKDRASTPWPASMPIQPGTPYSISWPGATQPTSVRFVILGSELKGLEDLASLLIKNGCTAQLDLLIDTVAVPDAGIAAGG